MTASLKIDDQASERNVSAPRPRFAEDEVETIATASLEKSSLWAVILALCVLALLLRLDFLTAGTFLPSNTLIDADEAIVGLMAKHMNEGRTPLPIFYYGQSYMGSFEPYCVSFVFKLLGDTPFALQLVPLFFSILLVPLAYFLTREIAGRRAGIFSAILIAIPPSPLVIWSAKARGGFVEVIALGAFALLVTAWWLKDSRPSLVRTAVIGLVLGFGWWTNNQIIYFIAPIGFAFIARLLHAPRAYREIPLHGSIGTLAFAVGSAPFWLHNLQHQFDSFGLFGRAPLKQVAKHLAGVLDTALPMLFGAERFWNPDPIFPGAVVLAFVLYGGILVTYAVLRPRQIASLVLLRIDQRQPLELFLLFLATTLTAFVFSTFGYLVEAPRYLLPLYIGLFGIAGFVLAHFDRRAPFLARSVLVAFLSLSLCSSYLRDRAIPGEPFVYGGERVSRDHKPLIEWLDARGYEWIETNYWIGYRLAFETDERIRFVHFQEPRTVRLHEYDQLGQVVPTGRMPYVLVPKQSDIVQSGLRTLGYTFSREMVGGYVVLYDVFPPTRPVEAIPRTEFTVTASHHADTANEAVDSDPGTRWGTGSPQRPGMTFTVSFTQPQRVAGFEMVLGQWSHDYPQKLEVSGVLPTGEVVTLLSADSFHAMRYVSSVATLTRVVFPATEVRSLTLRQLGSHGVLDWSLAELHLLREPR